MRRLPHRPGDGIDPRGTVAFVSGGTAAGIRDGRHPCRKPRVPGTWAPTRCADRRPGPSRCGVTSRARLASSSIPSRWGAAPSARRSPCSCRTSAASCSPCRARDQRIPDLLPARVPYALRSLPETGRERFVVGASGGRLATARPVASRSWIASTDSTSPSRWRTRSGPRRSRSWSTTCRSAYSVRSAMAIACSRMC
jgi:hypothetical protein